MDSVYDAVERFVTKAKEYADYEKQLPDDKVIALVTKLFVWMDDKKHELSAICPDTEYEGFDDEWAEICEWLRLEVPDARTDDFSLVSKQHIRDVICEVCDRITKSIMDVNNGVKSYVYTKKNPRWKFQVGDRVMVTDGEYEGQTGKILRVGKKKGWGQSIYTVKLDDSDYPANCKMKELCREE